MRTIVFLFIFTLLTFTSCKFKSNEQGSETKQAVSDTNPENLILMEFMVEGMTCTGCENSVKSGILENSGVAEVNASFTEAKVLVKFDSSMVRREDIEASIAGKGYRATGYNFLKIE